MKILPPIISTIILLSVCKSAHAAQGLVTLTAQGPGASNEVQISSSQSLKLVSGYDTCSNAEAEIHKDGKRFVYAPHNPHPAIVAGPAVVRLVMSPTAPPGCISFLTLDIQPAAFPPDKTVTVGAYSGNVQVTMEISTDLVNWTPAVNGMVYTNSPDARFFRIKLVTNATP
jgi:hypothetical protein